MNEISVSEAQEYDVMFVGSARFEYFTTITAHSPEEAYQLAMDFESSDKFISILQDGIYYNLNDNVDIEIDGFDPDEYISENNYRMEKITQEGSFVDQPNMIPGDKTKKKSPTDVMQKWRCTIDTLKQKLKKGIQVETEHSTNTRVAAEIALDHLYEDFNYYEKLDKTGLEEEPNEEQSGQISKWIKKGVTPPPPPPKKKVREITVGNEPDIIQQVKEFFNTRYRYISHSLSDSQINKFINNELKHRSCPKNTQEAVEWIASGLSDYILYNGLAGRLSDYILSNGLADDVQP